MTDPEKQSGGELIQGKWFTFHLEDIANVRLQLEKGELKKRHINFDDELPSPLTDIQIEIAQSEDTSFDHMYAAVIFNRGLTKGQLDSTWHQVMLEEIAVQADADSRKSPVEIHFPEHEIATCYLEIDPLHSFQIKALSDQDNCSLNLTYVSTHSVYDTMGLDSSEIPAPTPLNVKPAIVVDRMFRTLINMTDTAIGTLAARGHIVPPTHTHYRNVHLVQESLSGEPALETPELLDNEVVPTWESFDTIAGATEARQRLQEMAAVTKHPEIAQFYDIAINHVLLYGPAGTGKTSLVRAFARETKSRLLEFDSTHIVDMWVGNSGKKTAQMFDTAREAAANGEQVVLFVDEFDSIAKVGNMGSGEYTAVKNVLKKQLVEISQSHPNVIFAAATNADISTIDPALVRAGRLEAIYVQTPTATERVDVWRAVFIQSLERYSALDSSDPIDPYDPNIDFTKLADLTDGYTGADLKKILEIARRQKFLAAIATEKKAMINQRDIEAAIHSYHPVN